MVFSLKGFHIKSVCSFLIFYICCYCVYNYYFSTYSNLIFNFTAVIICPIVLAIIGIANPAVIIGLWPAHFLWTYFCVLRYAFFSFQSSLIFLLHSVMLCPHLCVCLWFVHYRTKRIGPVLKMAVIIALPVPLILWPAIGISGSVLGGIGYGFFAPLIATFEAVGKNATDKCYHCFVVSSSSFAFCLTKLLCFEIHFSSLCWKFSTIILVS